MWLGERKVVQLSHSYTHKHVDVLTFLGLLHVGCQQPRLLLLIALLSDVACHRFQKKSDY